MPPNPGFSPDSLNAFVSLSNRARVRRAAIRRARSSISCASRDAVKVRERFGRGMPRWEFGTASSSAVSSPSSRLIAARVGLPLPAPGAFGGAARAAFAGVFDLVF